MAVLVGKLFSEIGRALHIWSRVYGLFFQDALVYQANAVIWLLTDTIPAIIMPLIWLSSYNGRTTIGGFDRSQMVVYYMIVLFLSCIVESHIMWDIAAEIKDGRFNVSLVRPYPYIAYCYAGNLSWRLMRTVIFVPLFFVVLALFGRWVHWNSADYNFGWQFWLAVVLGHYVSFALTYALGLLSLYVVEARSLYNFYYLPLILFSGQIAPLTFFPPWLVKLALLLPFNYTLGFPAQIFIGRVQGARFYEGLGMQIFWLTASLLLSAALWRGGLKRYTAYGI